MATINVCDRCRKELTYRRTLVGLKPRGKTLSVGVFSIYPYDMNKATGNHSFEICDDCANELANFLGYRGNGVVEKEETHVD